MTDIAGSFSAGTAGVGIEDGGSATSAPSGADPTALNPEGDAPVVADGQADAAGETVEPKTLDLSEVGDHLVTVKRNGQEVQVPLNEAIAEGLRHADYTAKTQEVAHYKALQQALENPNTRDDALRLINDRYGTKAAQDAADANPSDDSWEANDPVAQRLAALEDVEFERALNIEVERLSGQYGDLFNQDEVFAAASQAGITDISQLEGVFHTLKFNEIYAKTTATQQVAEANAKEIADRQAAAAAIGGTVASGNGVAPGAAAAPSTSFSSVDSAFEAAWAASGMT